MLDTATHTTGAADNALTALRGALHVQATHAPAACERRALDGVAVFCVAMKCDGVKRLRNRSDPNVTKAQSRGRVYAFGALSGWHGVAKARGLRVL
jgi:hypothetical protein